MLLYATVSSERAKKGQGGNEYLLIEILDKNRDKLITLHITAARSNLRGEHYNIYLTNHQNEYIDMLNRGEKCDCGEYPCKYTKGKKQKGEKQKDKFEVVDLQAPDCQVAF